jgi:thioredoxin 1
VWDLHDREDAVTLTPVTEATFDEVLAAEAGLVLVDFWAQWCGPCKMVEPVLEDIAGIHRDRLTIVRCDVDEEPGLARRYGVMSMPTLMLFRDGEPVMRVVGARGKGQLLAEIDPFLAAAGDQSAAAR